MKGKYVSGATLAGMPVQARPDFGTVYLIHFANDVVKVGRSKEPDFRVNAQIRTARRAGIETTRTWFSPSHFEWVKTEQRLIDYAAYHLPRSRGNEYFVAKDLDILIDYCATLPMNLVRADVYETRRFRILRQHGLPTAEPVTLKVAAQRINEAIGDFDLWRARLMVPDMPHYRRNNRRGWRVLSETQLTWWIETLRDWRANPPTFD